MTQWLPRSSLVRLTCGTCQLLLVHAIPLSGTECKTDYAASDHQQAAVMQDVRGISMGSGQIRKRRPFHAKCYRTQRRRQHDAMKEIPKHKESSDTKRVFIVSAVRPNAGVDKLLGPREVCRRASLDVVIP